MKKGLFILLGLWIKVAVLHAQELPSAPNHTDQAGKRQGKWIILYDADFQVVSDTSQAEFYRMLTYQDGKPVGQVSDYYRSGQVQMVADSIVSQEPETYHGAVILYREDGSKELLYRFENGNLVEQTPYPLENNSEETEAWLTLNEQAMGLREAGKYQEAIAMLKEAKNLAEKNFGTSHANYATSCHNLAVLYIEQGLYQKAEPLCQEALNLIKTSQGEESNDYVYSLNSLALVYEFQGKYKQAEPLYLEALSIREKILGTDHPDNISTLSNLAALYVSQGLYEKANPLLEHALKIISNTSGEQHPYYATIMNNLAALLAKQGRYSQAEQLFETVRLTRQEILGKNHPDYAGALLNLAGLYRDQGLYDRSMALYQEALTITEKTLGQDHPHYATLLGNLAGIYSILGQYKKAEPLQLKALTIREKALGAQHPDYAATLNNLATIYSSQGIYEKARSLYQQVVAIQEETLGKKHPDYANSLNNIAKLLAIQGALTEAERLYLEAVDIIDEVLGGAHPTQAVYLSNLAEFYLSQKEYQKAETFAQKSLRILEKTVGTRHATYANALNYLASVYQVQGDYQRAEPLHKQARNLISEVLGTNHMDFVQSSNRLAGLYVEQGFYQKAAPVSKAASRALLWQIKHNLVHLSEREKNLFFQTLKHNLEIYHSLTLKTFTQMPSLTGWIYDLTLATKGLLFQSSQKIRRRIVNSSDSTLIQKFQQWQNQREYLAHIYTLSQTEKQERAIQTNQLEEQVNLLEKELSRRSELFAQAQDTSAYHWQDIQQILEPRQAAIEIIRTHYYHQNEQTDSVLYLALIIKPETRDQPELVVLPDGRHLEGKYLASYHNYIQNQTRDQVSYQQYWQPIAEKLENVEKVYFSADGVYHQINLNTLQNPQTGKYLLEEISLQLVNSTQQLVSPYQSKLPSQGAVLIGHPRYDLEVKHHQKLIQDYHATRNTRSSDRYTIGEKLAQLTLPDLPGTEVEVRQIHQQLQAQGWQSALYLNEHALEEIIKQTRSPRILHIATHGFFQESLPTPPASDLQRSSTSPQPEKPNLSSIRGSLHTPFELPDQNPMLRSGLLLAGVTSYAQRQEAYAHRVENGLLTAYEAMHLDLEGTELVVLSACETGKGKIQSGEGVYGLQRGFQQAGAESVLMSLWKVDDTATQTLMNSFYRHWIDDRMPKREAFQRAQLEMKAEYKYPYYWGAFVMVGE